MSGPTIGNRPPSVDLHGHIEKLSLDLVDAYEALTLVYRTVSKLGGMHQLDEIAKNLVHRAVEAVEASGGVLFLRIRGPFEVMCATDDLQDRLCPDAAARLIELGRPFFFNGTLAEQFAKPGVAPVTNLLAAPLESGGRAFGVLVLTRDDGDRFETGDAKLVGALCGLTAVAIANYLHFCAVNYEREMLEGVIREIGDGIVIADENWRSLLTNEAARAHLGIADDAREGYSILERLGSLELSIPIERLGGDAAEAQEFRAESRDRRRLLVLQGKTFRARFGAEGARVRVLCLRDVTNEQRDDNAQRDFLSLASHKLRTPLTKILGLLPVVRDDAVAADQRSEVLDGIEEGAWELRDLVEDLLRFVEFRQGERFPEWIVLTELLPEVQEAVGARRRDGRLELRIDVAPDTPRVFGSRTMLRNMLENLVDNAVKFSPGAVAMVTLSMRPAGEDRVRIAVADQGEGIAPEQLARLCRPFSQRDEEFTGQASGAGLGLALVHQVVASHGGSLTAESTLGAGSCFIAEIRVGDEVPAAGSKPD